jgi:hypothetical protein
MIADIKFTPDDTAEEIELKHKIIEQYNKRIAVRRDKKDYVIRNNLFDYKAAAEADSSRETEFERDLIARLRPLQKLREPKKHNAFVDLLIRKHQTER